MDCSDIRVYIPFLDDGSLDPEIEKETKLHLLLCSECRAEYESTRKLIGVIHSAYPERESSVSGDVAPLVWQGIRKRKRERFYVRTSLAAAAVMLITAGVFFSGLFNGNGPERLEIAALGDEYYSYVIEHYIPVSNIVSLTGELTENEEFTVDPDFLMESGYVNMTMDGMLQHLDTSQFEQMFQLVSY